MSWSNTPRPTIKLILAPEYGDSNIFIDVIADEVAAWRSFFADFGVDTRVAERGGDGIYFVLFPQDALDAEWVEHSAVTPLLEAAGIPVGGTEASTSAPELVATSLAAVDAHCDPQTNPGPSTASSPRLQ